MVTRLCIDITADAMYNKDMENNQPKHISEAENVREFALGDVLSVINDGAILSERGVDGIYDILDYMTGENLHNHQSSRVLGECSPALREQLPNLAEVQIPELDRDPERLRSWLGQIALEHGEKHPVRPLPPEDHAVIDSFDELRAMGFDPL